MHFLDDPTSRAYARATGVAYLTIAVSGCLAIVVIPLGLTEPGETLPSLGLIAEQRGLFALGLGFDAVMMVAEIAVTALLFYMFRPVQNAVSLAAALARFAMVAVMASMLFFQAGRLALIDVPMMATSDARPALDALLARMHYAGIGIWQVFFWVHLLLLGWLVRASGRFPALLGWGLMIGAFGYLIDTLVQHVVPWVTWLAVPQALLLTVVTLAELGFALWLIIRGQGPAEGAT